MAIYNVKKILGFRPVLFRTREPEKERHAKACLFFFNYIRLAASYIELRSVIFASQVLFASRVMAANIISLLR